MKKIITVLFFLIPCFAIAQPPNYRDTAFVSKGLTALSIMQPPVDTFAHKQGIAIKNNVLYIGDGTKWSSTTLAIYKKPGTDSVFFLLNGKEYPAFKDSSYNQPLLTNGSVPFVGPNGKLTEAPGYFTYIGGNLAVGSGGFNSSTGLSLNQGRAILTASGFGAVFGTTGGTPADPSKHIRFMNGSREYLDLNLPNINATTTPLEGWASMNWLPKLNDSFMLGLPGKQWKSAYIKDLYINGSLFNPNLGSIYIPQAEKAATNGVATLDNSGKVPLSQLPALTTNKPSYVQTLAEMLSSGATVGDLYVVGDSSTSYALATLPASTFSNWIRIQAPIPSNTDLLPEGATNKYYTDTRARNAVGVEGTGIAYNSTTGNFSNTRKVDWDAVGGSDNEIVNKPMIPLQFFPTQGANIIITGDYPDLTFSVSDIYTIAQTDSIATQIRSEIPVLTSFPAGAIPYGSGIGGKLTFVNPGFTYGSRYLKVGGDGSFGTTSTIELNGGNGQIKASGYGIDIISSGGLPIDPTKSINFYNGSRKWLTFDAPTVAGATLANNALNIKSNSHFYPVVTDSFRIGNPGLNWAKVFTNNLRITNGAGADKVWTSINSTGDGEWRTPAAGGSGMVYPTAGIALSSGSSSWGSSIANNSANWNTAFGWGNHAGLYLPIGYIPSWASISGKPTFFSGDYNDLINKPASGAGNMLKSENLSGLTDYSTARTNLSLGNVDNTSDANKPVSTLQAAAINAKENVLTFSGMLSRTGNTVTLPTVTANRILLSDGSGKVTVSTITNTQAGYLSSITSSVQTQLDAKYSGSVTTGNLPKVSGVGILSNSVLSESGGNLSTTGNMSMNDLTLNGTTIKSNNNLQLLTLGNAANTLSTGGILTSDSYSDITAVPANGIYSKGAVRINGLSNATGDVVTTSPNGTLQRRTLAQLYTDMGISGGGGGGGGVTAQQISDSILAHTVKIIPRGPLFKENDSLKIKIVSISDTGVVSPAMKTNWDSKQPGLVSGTNIKTINSATVLGSGNLSVQETLVSGTNIKTINSTNLLGSGNYDLQVPLVSGTNIKTINGVSILGSGNLVITGGGGGAGDVTLNGVETLTNKTIVERVTSPSVVTTNVTPNNSTSDLVSIITNTNTNIQTPSGTNVATDGQKLTLRIRNTTTPKTISFTNMYRSGSITLPTTIQDTSSMYVDFRFNKLDSLWDLVSLTTDFKNKYIAIPVDPVGGKDTVKVNFSLSPITVSGYNNMSGSPHAGVVTKTNMLDKNGATTAIGLSTIATGNWSAYSGISANDPCCGITGAPYYDATANNSSVAGTNFFNYGTITPGRYDASRPQFKISGLKVGSTYQLKITSIDGNLGFSSGSIFRVVGLTSPSAIVVDGNVTSQSSGATFTVKPTAAGEITIWCNSNTGSDDLVVVPALFIIEQ